MSGRRTPLVIVGAGGFGREVLDVVRDIDAAAPSFEVLGFLDDGVVDEELLRRVGGRLLGTSALLAELAADFVIGIGAAEPRRRIDALARSWGRTAATLRHPTATVGRDVEIGEGSVIAAGASLTTHIVLGRHVHLNLHCTVGHDAIVEDYVTLFPGVHLGGGVVVEADATLGTGCVVLPNTRIGRGAVVGAGAIVTRDVASDMTVVGAVARPTLRSPGSGASLDRGGAGS